MARLPIQPQVEAPAHELAAEALEGLATLSAPSVDTPAMVDVQAQALAAVGTIGQPSLLTPQTGMLSARTINGAGTLARPTLIAGTTFLAPQTIAGEGNLLFAPQLIALSHELDAEELNAIGIITAPALVGGTIADVDLDAQTIIGRLHDCATHADCWRDGFGSAGTCRCGHRHATDGQHLYGAGNAPNGAHNRR